jgi:hypothetical protein
MTIGCEAGIKIVPRYFIAIVNISKQNGSNFLNTYHDRHNADHDIVPLFQYITDPVPQTLVRFDLAEVYAETGLNG